MPLQRCSVNGKKGWRWGNRTCYVGEGAATKAMQQARAIRASGYTGNVKRNGNGSPDPLRRNPTRTTMLRKRFQGDISKRWRRIKSQIIDLIVRQDALGLRVLVYHTRWAFRSNAQKLIEFRKWLEIQFAGELLGQQVERAYWDAYIEEGWRTGAGRVFDDVKGKLRWKPGEGEFYKGSKQQFMEDSFNIPVSREKVKLLAGRVYTDLKGVTDDVAAKMSRTLTDGLVQGKNPRVVARDLNKELDLGRKRSLTIARTETIRAHAEGQLDAMELLGVEEVGVAVEWSTSGLGVTMLGNPSPCTLCAPLNKVVMTVKEARGLLPRHPGCMCSYIPANVGEDTEGQKRTKGEVTQAVDRSLKAEAPSKRTLAEQRGRSKWAGADKKIRKRRPQELVPKRVAKPTPVRPRARPVPIVRPVVPKPKPALGLIPRPVPKLAPKLKPIAKPLKAVPELTPEEVFDRLSIRAVRVTGSGGTEEMIKEAATTLDDLTTRFPRVGRRLGQSPLTELKVNGNRVLKGGAGGRYEVEGLTRTIEYSGNTKYWKPTSAKPSIGSKAYTVDESRTGFLRHEVGHHVYQSFPSKVQKTWLETTKGVKRKVSKYGATDEVELFAESFSAYTHSGYKSGMLPTEVEGFLDRFLIPIKPKG